MRNKKANKIEKEFLFCFVFSSSIKYFWVTADKGHFERLMGSPIFKHFINACMFLVSVIHREPGRIAQSVGHLTRKSEVLGSIPGLATYFRFSFR